MSDLYKKVNRIVVYKHSVFVVNLLGFVAEREKKKPESMSCDTTGITVIFKDLGNIYESHYASFSVEKKHIWIDEGGVFNTGLLSCFQFVDSNTLILWFDLTPSGALQRPGYNMVKHIGAKKFHHDDCIPSVKIVTVVAPTDEELEEGQVPPEPDVFEKQFSSVYLKLGEYFDAWEIIGYLRSELKGIFWCQPDNLISFVYADGVNVNIH